MSHWCDPSKLGVCVEQPSRRWVLIWGVQGGTEVKISKSCNGCEGSRPSGKVGEDERDEEAACSGRVGSREERDPGRTHGARQQPPQGLGVRTGTCAALAQIRTPKFDGSKDPWRARCMEFDVCDLPPLKGVL